MHEGVREAVRLGLRGYEAGAGADVVVVGDGDGGAGAGAGGEGAGDGDRGGVGGEVKAAAAAAAAAKHQEKGKKGGKSTNGGANANVVNGGVDDQGLDALEPMMEGGEVKAVG